MDMKNAAFDMEFAKRVDVNQRRLRHALKSQYDYIVCGAGASGSVVAGQLADNLDVSVLLIEAGAGDDVSPISEAAQWPLNLGSERDWSFATEPNPHLNGRIVPLSAGKVLGGSASINLMIWAHGHRSDWDDFAVAADDARWSHESVSKLYRQIEDWHGEPDPLRRGTGGPIFVQPAQDPGPSALAMLEAARAMRIPIFSSQNGAMMESTGGCALTDLCIRDGLRVSPFGAYVRPRMDRANLTVLTHAEVIRVMADCGKATGVEVLHEGKLLRIGAAMETVLSLGAIQTPKVLLQSGIGGEAQLRRFGIPIVAHLPGVGRNFQDHTAFGCIWESREPVVPRNNGAEATLYWKSEAHLDAPDLLACQVQFPIPSPETAALGVPQQGWTMFAGLARPHSRGSVSLAGANPLDPPCIETGALSDPRDLETALAAIELSREIGGSPAFHSLVRREAMPRALDRAQMKEFARSAAVSYGHGCGTAKMGRDAMSVVDGQLKVHGVERLRIADASIMPRITTGNTMAPCVIIGAQAAQLLTAESLRR